MRWIADIVYLVVGLLYMPVLLFQAVFRGKNRSGWSQRFGRIHLDLPIQREDQNGPLRIWLHAVSLGEVNATPRIIEQIESRWPNAQIVISTTTDTGFARAVQLYGHHRVFRYPLDFSMVISSVLKRINPSLIVLVELEVWFNLVRMASRRGVPVAVVNGRLTQRSATRLAALGALTKSMFRELRWVGAQDEAIAERFRDCGVLPDRVSVTSSLKWDSASTSDTVEGSVALAEAMGLTSGRPVWVCGSTGPGEEAILLDVFAQLLQNWMGSARGVQPDSVSGERQCAPVLVLVPRKPERFEEVARLIVSKGFNTLRRSQCAAGSHIQVSDRTVILGDTMGELRKFYSMADVVFVGRSLVPMGGSDPMEVAALGKPVVVGPHTDNFAMPIEALRSKDAVKIVQNAEELGHVVTQMLTDESDATAELGRRGRQVVLANQGATQRTMEGLATLLPQSPTESIP